MTVHELISQAVEQHPDQDADEVTAYLIAKLTPAHHFALLLGAVQVAMRGAVRRVETTAFHGRLTAAALTVQPVGLTGRSGVDALLREYFALGDGNRVSWGAATVEQHRERVAFLEAKRKGIAETVDRHQQAIRVLEETGARCLNDVGLAKAA